HVAHSERAAIDEGDNEEGGRCPGGGYEQFRPSVRHSHHVGEKDEDPGRHDDDVRDDPPFEVARSDNEEDGAEQSRDETAPRDPEAGEAGDAEETRPEFEKRRTKALARTTVGAAAMARKIRDEGHAFA